MSSKQINIVLPVYNEENRIKDGLNTLLEYLLQNPSINYVITILDNGSTDKTPEISDDYCKMNHRIRYERIEEKGVGIAFKRAVELNNSDFIGYMDIDMSTDINALGTTYKMLTEDDSIDIVNASRYSQGSQLIGRTRVRNFISYVWVFILKKVLRMKSNDSICGFKFFRQGVITRLLCESSECEYGWFLIIEVIIRAERMGYHIYELPVKWIFNDETKVKMLKVTISYLRGVKRLKKSLQRGG